MQPHEPLRKALARAFLQHSTTDLCWLLGAQAETPGVAFFIAYQAALRCLDPSLPNTDWGAFCVSEKGVRSPFLITTEYQPVTGQLKGQKSFVMQAGQGLNVYYILAKRADSNPVKLCLLKLKEDDFLNGQIQFLEAAAQPFMVDVPHRPMQFDLQISPSCLFLEDAHEKANKPFRYWEDVHVFIALAAWLQSRLLKVDERLELAVQQLQEQFARQPAYYTLAALDAFDAGLGLLSELAAQLPAQWQRIWQRDAMLLQLTAPLRSKIRTGLVKA